MRRAIGWLGVIGLGAGAGAVYWRRRQRQARRPDWQVHTTTPDEAVAAQVRLRLGRYVERPQAVHVRVEGGRVVLTGEAWDREADDLVAAIGRLPGVRAVEDRLALQAR